MANIRLTELVKEFGSTVAVKGISLDVENGEFLIIVGPSGCGKSTLLRSFNRMNDLIPNAVVSGEIIFHGQNIYEPHLDPTEIRYQMGMVFQKPNPFPKKSLIPSK